MPKIKLFKSNEFNKVIYQDEFFVGERNSIIINFIKKYQQRDLTQIELTNVIRYINHNKKNNEFDILSFLFLLELLIDIILESSPDINEKLNNIIKVMNDSPNIKIIKNFLNSMEENIEDNDNNDNNSNLFTVNCLINLIDILELYCWDSIKNNLDKKYIENIDNNTKSHFDKYFEEHNLEENSQFVITKIDLCSAIRKFISRYLMGKNIDYINPKDKIKNYLTNIELWPINCEKKEIIEIEINKIFVENGNIDINQAVKLYEYLGGDLIKLKEIEKINISENETNEKNENENNNNIQNLLDLKKEENIINKEEENEEEEEDSQIDDDDENSIGNMSY